MRESAPARRGKTATGPERTSGLSSKYACAFDLRLGLEGNEAAEQATCEVGGAEVNAVIAGVTPGSILELPAGSVAL